MHVNRRDVIRMLPAAATLVSASAQTQGQMQAAVSEAALFLDRLAGYGFSGILGVAEKGKILLERGFGFADREKGLKVQPDQVYSVGSITKQFTAAAILKLEAQGKLSTADPISKHLPGIPADKSAITIHHLLTHTAGLRPDYGDTDFETVQRDEYVARVMAAPLDSAPGARFRYSNAGYSLAAAIVERTGGVGYEQFCREHLFLPAGMRDTGYLLPKFAPGRLATGYREGNRWGTILERPMAADGPYWNLRGNGGIHSTAGDMLRWHIALMANTVLTASAREKFETGYVAEGPRGLMKYAYGWSTSQSRYGKLVEHNGGNGIFAANFCRYVDRDVALFIASNVSEWPAIPFTETVADRLFGEKLPAPPAVISIPKERLQSYSGTYSLAGGEKLHVAAEGDGLRLSAEGQQPVSLLLFGRIRPMPVAEEITKRTLALLRVEASGVSEEVLRAWGRNAPVEEIRKRRTSFWNEQRSRFGDFKEAVSLGTAMERGDFVSYSRLVFENGSVITAHVWEEDGPLLGVRVANRPPSRVFLPTGQDEFSTVQIPTGQPATVRFKREGQSVRLEFLDAAGSPTAAAAR